MQSCGIGLGPKVLDLGPQVLHFGLGPKSLSFILLADLLNMCSLFCRVMERVINVDLIDFLAKKA